MFDRMSQWTRVTRTMLRDAAGIGAKPFILFLYYKTWENARDGIFPPLKMIANDLGMEPSAICNLRKRLVTAGWIKIENGRILIEKTFTQNEDSSHDVNKSETDDSQNMNGNSQKMNPAFTKNESALKGLDIKNSSKKKSKKTEEPTRIPDPFPLTDEMEEWLLTELPRLRDPKGVHENFIEYYTNCQTKKALRTNWQMTWKKGMRLAQKWQDRDDTNGTSKNHVSRTGESSQDTAKRLRADAEF